MRERIYEREYRIEKSKSKRCTHHAVAEMRGYTQMEGQSTQGSDK